MSPLSQVQITFPCLLQRPEAMRDSIWIDLACRLLETRLLRALRFRSGKVGRGALHPLRQLEWAEAAALTPPAPTTVHTTAPL